MVSIATIVKDETLTFHPQRFPQLAIPIFHLLGLFLVDLYPVEKLCLIALEIRLLLP